MSPCAPMAVISICATVSMDRRGRPDAGVLLRGRRWNNPQKVRHSGEALL
jgi:hypothetical protein